MSQENSKEIEQVRHYSRTIVRELGLLRYIEKSQSKKDVNLSQCHALLLIDELGSVTVNELAERLQLNKSTTSRTVANIINNAWAKSVLSKSDKRSKIISLTKSGQNKIRHLHIKANNQVQDALSSLSETQRKEVLHGLNLYSKALSRSRSRKDFSLRGIKKSDNPDIAKYIRNVMSEHGCNQIGDSFDDIDIKDMYSYYGKNKNSAYLVVLKGDTLVGGAGYAELPGVKNNKICELRKMFLLSSARGLGLGRALLEECLSSASKDGYTNCYLETTERMPQAVRLYKSLGFNELSEPMGDNGHSGADMWFIKKLAV